jgi:predicted amidophosphoribosyltransferase
MRFKVGEEALAYPLSLGMYNVLMNGGVTDVDAVVPIPLSPDKEKAGEINRTRLLARELCRLLGAHLASVLSLSHAISKHKLRIHKGFSVTQFEAKYSEALAVDTRVREFRRLLLIDDVCTEGSTLRCAVGALRAVHPNSEISLATAGQMIVKNVVKYEAPLLAASAAVA